MQKYIKIQRKKRVIAVSEIMNNGVPRRRGIVEESVVFDRNNSNKLPSIFSGTVGSIHFIHLIKKYPCCRLSGCSVSFFYFLYFTIKFKNFLLISSQMNGKFPSIAFISRSTFSHNTICFFFSKRNRFHFEVLLSGEAVST